MANDQSAILNTTDSQRTSDCSAPQTIGLPDYLWIYLAPIVFTLGVAGNVLTMAVMNRKSMTGSTTSVYLSLIAIADTSTLVMGVFLVWFEKMQLFTFYDLHPIACKFDSFIFYTSCDTAVWILVAFTLDRFIAVCFPLKKRLICVPERSKIAALMAMIGMSIKNVHVFWTRGEALTHGCPTNCGMVSGYEFFENSVRPWMAFTIFNAIPFITFLTCNFMIICKLVEAMRTRVESRGPLASGFRQTVMMCMSVSFVFLLLVTPSIILRIGKTRWAKIGRKPNPDYELAKAVNNILAMVNHAINFFLYCLTGQKFRSELVAMIREGFGDSPPGTPHTGNSLTLTPAIQRRRSTTPITLPVIPNGIVVKHGNHLADI